MIAAPRSSLRRKQSRMSLEATLMMIPFPSWRKPLLMLRQVKVESQLWEMANKTKQSRGEKKARKIMSNQKV